MTRRSSAVALWIGLSMSAFAQGRPCSEVKDRHADAAVDTLTSWDRLYQWYKTYGECDDGVMAEGYSEAVARNLVDRWKTLPRLAELARKDDGFQPFVLKHLNQTLNDDDLKKIRANAESRCPAGLHRLCGDVKKQAEAP
jgi:hypothetical protein